MKHVYKKVLLFLFFGVTLTQMLNAEQAFENEQYQKALWMTTRFYGAQRSGEGPNWLLANYSPTNVASKYMQYNDAAITGQSYLKDADSDGYDLVGGWFDCADFVKFGQTEFYSAYVLLLGYSEFPKGYQDLYSADYNGYIGSDDFTWESQKGVPNGIPDILDEVKYATDYFIKCIRSSEKFYYQVGEGGADHKVWVTSVFKSGMPKSLGGEREGSRTVYGISEKGTTMVAFCGASLAAMSRLYRQYDASYADLCLLKAKMCLEFINNRAKGNIGAPGGFYGSKSKYEPDVCTFLVEMYRATGEQSYLDQLSSYNSYSFGSKTWNHGYTFCYNNTEDISYYNMGMYAGDTLAKSHLKYFVEQLYKPKNGYILNVKNNEWGILRYPANQAFVYGLYKNMIGELDEVDPYSLGTIEYIMGSNDQKYSFIVGFGDKFPRYPHYRNVYLDDSDSMALCKIDEKHIQLGYMVGGDLNPSKYPDDINNYKSGEGGIDYNAGLVGALGYINSIINPVSTADINTVVYNDVQCYLYPNPVVNVVKLQSKEVGDVRITIYNVDGDVVKTKDSTWEKLRAEGISVADLNNGSYVLSVVAENASATKQFLKK